MSQVVRFIFICWVCFGVMVPQAYAQAEEEPDRQLRVLEPADEVQHLDPAFEMIMDKIDGDLRYIISSPVRMTPKGTAITGLTLPFMSYGGSSILASFLSIGLVISVHMRRFR